MLAEMGEPLELNAVQELTLTPEQLGNSIEHKEEK